MDNDEAYANAAFIPGGDAFPDRWADAARSFREELTAEGHAELDLGYGDHPREVFDLFRPEGRAEGLVVFVHGGFWRAFDKSDWSHFAAGVLARGWAVAMPSYPLAPEVRMARISRSVARAVDAAAARVAGPIRLTGHSAGGHLALRVVGSDRPLACRDRIASVMPISPLTDLRPLMDTAMNADFRLDPEEAVAESPALHPRPDVPVTVWIGADERPGFLEQVRAIEAAWGCEVVFEPGRHHFDVIDGLLEPDTPMMKTLLG